LVGMSSGYLMGDPNRASYRAAKAGVVALTKSVAMAGEPLGIRANAVAPRANTRMTEASKLRFDSEPEDVAPLTVYLLSELAAEVNGEVLTVAGNTIESWQDPAPAHSARNWRRWEQEDIAAAMPWLLDRRRGPMSAPPLG
jgi:NAD(P)-dependent dehydrogenase (short-subunit alcohol dehydrogenase family)